MRSIFAAMIIWALLAWAPDITATRDAGFMAAKPWRSRVNKALTRKGKIAGIRGRLTRRRARLYLTIWFTIRPTTLDRTFAALADPTRRALLAQLSERDSISVSELAKPFAMSLPAVMKHLDVLSDAGLVTREKIGRTVSCRLRAEPMREANDWLNRYQRFWTERLDRLAAFLEEEPCPPSSPSQAKPHHQAPFQGAAGESLRRLDRPGKNEPLDGAGAMS